MNESAADLAIMIRQLRTELEWAMRTGVVPPPVEALSTRPEPASVEPDPVAAPEAEPEPHREPLFSDGPPIEAYEEPQAPRAPPEPARPAPEHRPPEQSPPEQSPPEQRPATPPSPVADPVGPAAAPSSPRPRLQVVQGLLDKCADLQEVQEVVADCTRCKLAGLGRSQIVFGVGNPNADVMFIGEGPGRDEDRQGEPFVGRAGQLLTKIIEAGMKMSRAEVYIANIVKCRPPNNRDPEPDEVQTCRPFVEAQIRLIQPKVIVTLGRYASQTLLSTSQGMKRMRGSWQEYDGIPVMPTFHPAYLLRNEAEKAATWKDIQEVLRFIGRPVRGKEG